MDNWTKYTYLCTECDALIEVTANVFRALDPACICQGQGIVILLEQSDGNAPIFEPVTKVTPSRVVKIDSNPYN